MVVRALTTDDYALYRDVRLQALVADPGAFGSTYERESTFTDDEWRERVVGGDRLASFFVDELDDVEGLAVPGVAGTGGIFFSEWDPQPMVVGMWVDPAARGRGSGRRLLDATVAWARQTDATDVMLWVVQDNAPAIALYERYGFVASGKVDTVPSNPCAEELEMRMPLT
jgi:GNAT superfamily N-acetyltransferase